MIPEYSGIVFINNVPPTSSVSLGTVYQTFVLPNDFVRAPETDPTIPYLTGFSVNLTAPANAVNLPWTIQHLDTTGHWDTIGSGVVTNVPITVEGFWENLFSESLITINPTWLNDTFRFGLGIDGTTVTNVYTITPNPLASQNIEGYVYTNMISNPSFAYDVTGNVPAGWAVAGEGVLTVTSTPSLEISTSHIGDGATSSVSITGEFFKGFTYTLALQAKGQNGGESITISLEGLPTDQKSANFVLTTAYSSISLEWTPENNYDEILVNILSNSATDQNFFIQEVMVNAGSVATFVDGDTTGYSWSGQPGNSPTIQSQGSLLFSLLALVADEGIDILGNLYRSNVAPYLITNVNTETTPDEANLSWISRPNPSSQAVECIYIDISDDNGEPTVFDSILLDPITQGVDFNVYFSSDGDAVVNASDWDNKLWQHVPQEFTLIKRDTYMMPRSITANYVKLEFTNLQGQNYNPKGEPTVIYNKFPSWVFFYFLLQTMPPQLGEDYFIGNQNTVIFDYLDFAYNYYTGQAIQSATLPAPVVQQLQYEINQSNTTASNLDPTTLGQIHSNLTPFQNQPVLLGPSDYLPAAPASDLGGFIQTQNYSIEEPFQSYSAQPLTGKGNYVSSRIKDGLIQELTLPQMYFWQTCRHSYKQVQAGFVNNRAYYVGLRELGFLRQNFNVPVDTPVYYETFSDTFNQVTD